MGANAIPRRPGQALYRKNRLVAPDACEANGWEVGTVIVSEKWNGPRTIVHVGPIEIEVRYGTNSQQFCKTLPDDTRAVPDGP